MLLSKIVISLINTIDSHTSTVQRDYTNKFIAALFIKGNFGETTMFLNRRMN
jgi:hypothetical protein